MKADTFARETLLLLSFVFLTSLFIREIDAKPIFAFVLLLPLLFYATVRAPVHITARVLLALGLFIEPPDMIPGAGYWVSPLEGANETLYGSLKTLINFPASFPLFFFCALTLWYRARRTYKPVTFMAAPPPAIRMVTVFLGVVLAMWGYGMLRGGAPTPSFFQVLQLLCLPIFTLGCLYSIRGKDDFRALCTIIVLVALARSALVAWVYLVVCAPLGVVPEYATTHGDSVIFDAAFLILVTHFIEVRTKRALVRLIGFGGVILVAIAMNNRRLAFVGLGAGLVTIILFLPRSVAKRKVFRQLLWITPLLVGYIVIGGANPLDKNPIYAPARLVTSVIEQNDTSSDARDVENDNLLVTLDENNPLIGPGFGFEYHEVTQLYDISQYFPLYKYIAHNSVLWLLTIGGLFGFTALWMLFAFNAYFSARAYRLARTSNDRAVGLFGLGMTFVCITADWGDQGLTSFPNLVLFAVTYAMVTKATAQGERAIQIERDIDYLLSTGYT
jgi:hypothetical protein